MQKKALVFLAEGFEEIEAVTAIDILRRAGVDVTVAGLGSKTIPGSRGIPVVTDIDIGLVEERYDAYILPGGAQGANNLARSKTVGSVLEQAFKAGKIIAAICAAPAVVLSPLGLLKNKSATCYPGMEKGLGKDTKYVLKNVVVDGNVVTGQGPANALVFALAIVDRLAGKDIGDKVRKATLADVIPSPTSQHRA